MELPFLKNKSNKNNQGGSITVKADKTTDFEDYSGLRKVIVRELWDAMERKDEESFVSSFEALILNLQEQDEEMDEA